LDESLLDEPSQSSLVHMQSRTAPLSPPPVSSTMMMDSTSSHQHQHEHQEYQYNLHHMAISLNNLGCRIMNDASRLSESALLFELALDTEKKALEEYYAHQGGNMTSEQQRVLHAANCATGEDLQEMIQEISQHLDEEQGHEQPQHHQQQQPLQPQTLPLKMSLKNFGSGCMMKGFTIDLDSSSATFTKVNPDTANYLWTGMMFNTALVLHLTAVEMDMEHALVDDALEEYTKAHTLALGLDDNVGNDLRTAIRTNVQSLTGHIIR